jgi:hypothetical protein
MHSLIDKLPFVVVFHELLVDLLTLMMNADSGGLLERHCRRSAPEHAGREGSWASY